MFGDGYSRALTLLINKYSRASTACTTIPEILLLIILGIILPEPSLVVYTTVSKE